MIIRQIDGTHDWTFGKGKNDYVTRNAAVIQNIDTRLNMYLGDCFFDLANGVDWFNLLGAKDEAALTLAVSSVILNTQNVTGLQQVLVNLSSERNLTVQYAVRSAFSLISSTFQLGSG